MTHPVREHLIRLTNDGGPGFVRLGMDGYRHGAVRFSETGKWRKAPILPSQRTRVLDGIFGYGGIRTLPAAGAAVTAELREPRDEAFSWTLSYKLPKGAGLSVRMGDRVTRLTHGQTVPEGDGQDESKLDQPVESATQESEPPEGPSRSLSEGGIKQAVFRGQGSESFSVTHFSGDPQVFGAFGEYERSGLVFDTVGINGARAATVLAWRPEQYIAQLARRGLDLIVLAFGTNEVFDQTNPSRYGEHFSKILEMAREAKPDVSCWIVGPPDSAATGGGSKERVSQVTDVQRKAAESLGCAFSSAYELMGREGSFSAWARKRPALARTDRIHLTIAGYEALGRLLADALVLPPDEVESERTVPEARDEVSSPPAAR
jgi:lysophospholipase L1-like esterase